MSTDIHMMVEVYENDHWVSVNQFDDDPRRVIDPVYNQNNYDVFAVLANVRNGVGFAGIITGDPLPYIDKPRGLPDDVSPEVKACSDAWGEDAHDHSWLTLDEILNFDAWGDGVNIRYHLSLVGYYLLRQYHDRDVLDNSSLLFDESRVISTQEADQLIDECVSEQLPVNMTIPEILVAMHPGMIVEIYVRRWLNNLVGEEFLQAVRRLIDTANQRGVHYDQIRIVFFFDS